MPYIKQKQRKQIVEYGEKIYLGDPDSAGELNFVITTFIHEYLKNKGLKYQNINEVIGVLECAKLELYRMVAAPYENKKKLENGAISNLDGKSLEDVR